jgi:hypothetical protein
MANAPTDFDRQVFINCPFDAEYQPLLRSLIFTILDCHLTPRIASEEVDSGRVRFEKIRGLIRACRFSIHDISRIEPLHPGDLPRFNMPFELGLDLGCRLYATGRLASKQCLILERERYQYQRVLSDISGNDIRAHGGNPQVVISELRNWFAVATGKDLPSSSDIWKRFNLFQGFLLASLEKAGFTTEEIDRLEPAEWIRRAVSWIASPVTDGID